MRYRRLGATGIDVSVLSVGTWQLSGPVTLDGEADGFPDVGRAAAVRLIHACQDLGISGIDTAEVYGDGEGERRIGEALKGRRDRWIITTKFGLRRGPGGERVRDASPRTIRSSLEGSLSRLATDHVDVFLYHVPPGDTADAGREILETLKREGKLRAYGISTSDHLVLGELVRRNAAQVVLLRRSLRTEPRLTLELARAHGLGVMVRGALAGGLLSGKYFRQSARFVPEDIRSLGAYPARRYALYDHLRPPDMPMVVFALRYLLDFEDTHTIVLGGKSIDDYRLASAAVEAAPLGLGRHVLVRNFQRVLNAVDRTAGARQKAARIAERFRGASARP